MMDARTECQRLLDVRSIHTRPRINHMDMDIGKTDSAIARPAAASAVEVGGAMTWGRGDVGTEELEGH